MLDRIKEFIDHCCEIKRSNFILSSHLFKHYKEWCFDHGYHAMSKRSFGLNLSLLDFKKKKTTNGQRGWIGIKINQLQRNDKYDQETSLTLKLAKVIESMANEIDDLKERLNDYKEENRQLRNLKNLSKVKISKTVHNALIKYGD